MVWYLEFEGESYESALKTFEWDYPNEYNIARDCVEKHDRNAVALRQGYPNGRRKTYTFGELDDWSARVAGGIVGLGVERGDRVAIALDQRPETLVSHLACWKIGAVSVPLSVLFGNDALRHRIADSESCLAIADATITETLEAVRSDCPSLDHIVTVGSDDEASARDDPSDAGDTTAGDHAFDAIGRDKRATFDIAATTPDDPALLIYTSGTTGPAKGVVHTQSIWLSYCPAFCMYFEQPDPRPTRGIYWTPSDWSWIGGLGTVVFPAWHYGRPIVGRPIRKFDAETAYDVLETFGVTHASFPPTALRILRDEDVLSSSFNLSLEVLISGSEPLTPDIVEWVESTFSDVVINEGYGQTEVGNIVTNCHRWFPLRTGSMGKSVPGYDVAILDRDADDPVPVGERGEIAVRATDDGPGVFERYWNEDDKTGTFAANDEWHRTGDLARCDEDGYVWFDARNDDLIITSGYRIAPNTVERTLLNHGAVTAAGVVGIPDDQRGERIAAFITLRDGTDPSVRLREELRDLVRESVAGYAYPREITFVERLPTTRTGKVDRQTLLDEKR